MPRTLCILALSLPILEAATLQQLSLAEMTDKATAIVRARVGSCSARFQGPTIYTTCQLSVVERWKGSSSATVQVSIPGGAARGVRQIFSGAPALNSGDERILFLWTGRSGATQILGLSQGLMTIERLADGTVMAVRSPVRDRMLDSTGRPVWDEGVEMPVERLRQAVAARAAN